MKIVYHVPIMEKLASALTSAGDYGRKIDTFVLTEKEYDEFVNDSSNHHCKVKKDDTFYFYDIPVITEEEYRKSLEEEAI